jgi:hypothetical protein
VGNHPVARRATPPFDRAITYLAHPAEGPRIRKGWATFSGPVILNPDALCRGEEPRRRKDSPPRHRGAQRKAWVTRASQKAKGKSQKAKVRSRAVAVSLCASVVKFVLGFTPTPLIGVKDLGSLLRSPTPVQCRDPSPQRRALKMTVFQTGSLTREVDEPSKLLPKLANLT